MGEKQAATQFSTTLYTRENGWSNELPSHLDGARTLVLAFGASGENVCRAGLDDLRRAFPGSVITGCSTSGEILGADLWDEALSVGVFRFRDANVRQATVPVRGPQDSFHAGHALAEQLSLPDLRAVMVFSDGLNVNGTELVRGITSALDPSVTVTGGLAGDGAAFTKTWVCPGGEPRELAVTAVGLYGPSVRVGHGSSGGWDEFGPERLVTRSKGNVLYELDGQPALTLYKQYLGERADELPSSALLFPLAVRAGRGDERVLVRTILAVSENDRSMTFAGDVPEGSVVRLMRANFERLVGGAAESAQMTGITPDAQPCLCVAISCVGRRIVLGARTEDELEAIESVLPPGSGVTGFYSYGEISPFGSGTCELHNQTMTITTISERDDQP